MRDSTSCLLSDSVQGDWWSRTWIGLILNVPSYWPSVLPVLPNKQSLAESGMVKMKSTKPRSATTNVTLCVQRGTSGQRLVLFHPLPNSAWADGKLSEVVEQVGKMGEYPGFLE